MDRIAEARAELAARIQAAGGAEAYQAQAAARRSTAEQQRAQQEAATAAERDARLAARVAVAIQFRLAAEAGQWTVAAGQPQAFIGGYTTVEDADVAAETLRADGTQASIFRPHCGHAFNRYGDAVDACATCARLAAQASIPARR
jgi:hypothetical protein